MTLEFYATNTIDHIRQFMPDVPYLFPASSWARSGTLKPVPRYVSDIVSRKHRAADCGGFVATKIWGDYRYTPDEYVNWLHSFTPQWAATMDYCCEDEITSGNTGIVCQRQEATTDMAHLFWNNYRDEDGTWVPTIQGWHVADYVRHARQMKPLLEEMQAHYHNDVWRVGIGTLCNRASVSDIVAVLGAVRREIGDMPIHLWGVKLGALQSKVLLRNVVSVDSAAWMPGGLHRTGIEAKAHRQELGLSQRQYMYQIALPRYLEKVTTALSKPKQTTMF